MDTKSVFAGIFSLLSAFVVSSFDLLLSSFFCLLGDTSSRSCFDLDSVTFDLDLTLVKSLSESESSVLESPLSSDELSTSEGTKA